MNVLECKDLKLGYAGKTVLESISFSVEKGSFLFLLGENGSGKTTFLKSMLGLLKAERGSIEWLNIPRNKVSYLSQVSDAKNDFPASVKEIVLSGRAMAHRFSPFYTAKDIEKAEAAMKYMSIEDLADKSFSSLSGGQQQRVLLARSICVGAKVMVLDEPTKGLDERTEKELYEFLSHQNQKHGVTVIMVSHDESAALKYGTNIIRLENGKIVFNGAVK